MTTEWWTAKIRESQDEFKLVLRQFDGVLSYGEVWNSYALVKILGYLDSMNDELSDANRRER